MATAKQAPAKGKAPGTTMTKHEPQKMAVSTESDLDLKMLLEDAAQRQQFNKDDLAIPFIRVLQKGSPQVNKRDDAYIDGAEPGMFINTASGKLYDGDEGILVVPIAYAPSYIEWRPRDEGGGFIKDHGSDSSIMAQTTRDENGKDVLPSGNEVVRSGQYFVFVVDEGGFEQAVMALSGTQLKKSRKWNTLIQSLRIPRSDGIPGTFNPAPFYMAYRITTVFEKNDKGDWMGVDIKPEGPVTQIPRGQEVYLAAREFRSLVNSGMVKVKYEETLVSEDEVEITPADDDDKF